MGHKLKAFHPARMDKTPGGVLLISLLLVLGMLMCAVAGFWNHSTWFGTIPGALCVLWVVLGSTHEASMLNSSEWTLYDAYNRLSAESRNHVPVLTPRMIESFTDDQRRLTRNAVNDLLSAEKLKAEQEADADPIVRDLLEALQIQRKVLVSDIQDLKKLNGEKVQDE